LTLHASSFARGNERDLFGSRPSRSATNTRTTSPVVGGLNRSQQDFDRQFEDDGVNVFVLMSPPPPLAVEATTAFLPLGGFRRRREMSTGFPMPLRENKIESFRCTDSPGMLRFEGYLLRLSFCTKLHGNPNSVTNTCLKGLDF
jgi:hypothetical protein